MDLQTTHYANSIHFIKERGYRDILLICKNKWDPVSSSSPNNIHDLLQERALRQDIVQELTAQI